MNDADRSLVVRIVQPADLEALAGLLSHIEDLPLKRVELEARVSALQGYETPILAWSAGRAVGLASLRIHPSLTSDRPFAELCELFVVDEDLGGEIERALLEKARALAQETGAVQISLLTGLKNSAAQARYRALGFREYALAMRLLLGGPFFAP
jgi:ribosomal protein S18 acetylase RimI-like enzyme